MTSHSLLAYRLFWAQQQQQQNSMLEQQQQNWLFHAYNSQWLSGREK